jgi:hypothetical protein
MAPIASDRASFGGGSPNPKMTRANAYGGQASRGMGKASARSGTEPVYAAHEMVESYKDGRKVEQTAKLYEEMVGFPNLANDRFVHDQAKQAVQTSMDDVFTTMQYLRNKFLTLYLLYRGEGIATGTTYGRMRLHSPTPFKVVENLHPRLMRALFGTEQWFKLYGVAEDHDEPAKAQEALCREQLRATKFKPKASRFIRSGLIYGTSIQKTYWKQDPQERAFRIAKRVPDPKVPGGTKVVMEDVKRVEMMFDGNDVVPISIFDFQGPPSASSIEEAEWCLDKSMWPDYRVKKMVELGHWKGLEALEQNPGSNDFIADDPFKQRKAYAYGMFDGRGGLGAPHVPQYEVVDYWGPLVIKNDDGNYTTRLCNIVAIEPRSLCLIARVTVCPFWHGQKPYQVWRPIALEGELFGIGAIEMIARLSVEKDMKRQLLMAATQLEAAPMLGVSDSANLSAAQLLIQPGLIIRTPNPREDIVPLQFNAVSDSALKAENILEAEMREVSGVTSPVIGTNDPMSTSSKTATQYTSELDEANLRIAGMGENYEQEVATPMLDQMAWNNMQFQNYERVIRDVGPMGVRFRDRVTIRPEDLLGRFIVQPLSGFRLTTKRTQVQQLINLLDRGPIINQMYGPNAVKMPKLLAYIMETAFDIRNVDEFVQLPPEEARLLTAVEEEELWFHGVVPPRRPDDNDMRHIISHEETFGTDRFDELEKADPGTAAKARAHVADHYRKMLLAQEIQEKLLMEQAQLQSMLAMGGGDSPGASAAEPGQDPGSPKVRNEEGGHGEEEGGGEFKEAKSEGMRGAPNTGAS